MPGRPVPSQLQQELKLTSIHQIERLGARPSIRRILLAKDERVGFHLAA
jgi:hypothetical protein